MISFFTLDYFVITLFFSVLIAISFYFYKHRVNSTNEYFLSNRGVGLFLFIATNVATWYGGILGVGEYTYRYGISSWFTQGLPYYIFAIIFAFFFARKIRKTNFFTIPELIRNRYDKKTALLVAVLIFILTSPAPYLLMIGYLISIIFGIAHIYGIIFATIITVSYLFYGGYKSNIITDLFLFVIMYAGFVAMFLYSYNSLGDIEYLQLSLPETHFTFTGGANYIYIITWFFIALWTFADPGFHQRCYSAKKPSIAFWGIILSVPLWFIFDFFTTSAGLYARAFIPNIEEEFLAFPLLADSILPAGIKGLFFIALFATILSTLNSFLFISAQTYGRDILQLIRKKKTDSVSQTRKGLIISSLISIILALSFDSIIDMWYMIGSICIPGIILLVLGAYHKTFSISANFAFWEVIAGSGTALTLSVIKHFYTSPFLEYLEPMLIGLLISFLIHLFGMISKKRNKNEFLSH